MTIGQSTDTAPNKFFIAGGSKSTLINQANDFGTTKGGEYFFMPSVNLSKNGFDLSRLLKVGVPVSKLCSTAADSFRVWIYKVLL